MRSFWQRRHSKRVGRIVHSRPPRLHFEQLEARRVLYAVNSSGSAGDADLFDGVCDSDLSTPGQQITFNAAAECINVDGGGTITFGAVGGAIVFGTPINVPVTVDGGSAVLSFSGTLTIQSDGSTVQDLNAPNAGVSFTGQQNTLLGSTVKGVALIGDQNVVQSSRISGSSTYGLQINGSSNTVVNNLIGTDENGTGADPNNFGGILIDGTSTNNMILQNVISGNNKHGIYISGSLASGNHIEGNKIGVDVNGNTKLSNSYSGIQIEDSPNNVIDGNVISGNLEYGIRIRKVGTNDAYNNVISNNKIGVGEDGTTDLGNNFDGIKIDSGVAKNAPGNLAVNIQNNVISGNGEFSGAGVFIAGADVQLTGNRIGTNALGTAAVANSGAGVQISHTLANDGTLITIGGADPGDLTVGNLISGNNGSGIETLSAGIHDITIQGNRIGTNADGDAEIHNGSAGISLSGYSVLIGGDSAAGKGNLVSGNLGNGMSVSNPSPDLGVYEIQGNIVGLNDDGDAKIPNQGAGISATGLIFAGFNESTMGDFGNTISGNKLAGIRINSSTQFGAFIVGNRIGTSKDGMSALGNEGDGILLDNAGAANVGFHPVDGNLPRNVISGNAGAGVRIRGVNASADEVQNNYIGLGADGKQPLGNAGPGVVVENGASLITIGDKDQVESNRIANNGMYGVLITGATTHDITVRGNYIGFVPDLVSAPGNVGGGIAITDGAHDNTIQENVIAGHTAVLPSSGSSTAFGVGILGSAAVKPTNNVIRDNKIGTNAAADTVLANTVNVQVVLATLTSINGNTIAGGDVNVYLKEVENAEVVKNTLGNMQLASPGAGIWVVDSTLVEIGGESADNFITHHQGHGIVISGSSNYVEIVQNHIWDNGGLGIALDDRTLAAAVRPTLSVPVIVGGTNLEIAGSLVGKPNTQYTLQFYSNASPDPSGFGEGTFFIDAIQVNTNEFGFVLFNFTSSNLTDGHTHISATATEESNTANTTYDFSHTASALTLESAVEATGNLLNSAWNFIVNVGKAILPNLQSAGGAAASASAGAPAPAADPVPTGVVLIYDNGVRIGSVALDQNGHADFTSGTLGPGAHHLFAIYEGDDNYGGSVSEHFLATVEGGPMGASAGQGGTNPDDEGRSVVVDSSGNSYVVGILHYADGASDSTTTKTGDIFLAKYDRFGTQIWQRTIGGSGDDRGLAIARDSSNNVYVTGMFQGTVDFNPSSSTNNLTSRGGFDIFVASYTKNGSYRWARNYGNTSTSSSNADIGYGIAVGADGKVLVTGQFAGTVDFDASSSTLSLKSKGTSDIFVMRLTSGGSTSWAKQIGGTGADCGTAVTTDSSNRVYVTGGFSGTADFNPSSSTNNLTSAGGKDAFLARFSSGGSYSYARKFGGTANDEGHAVAVDPSNNVYLTGYFAGTADLDPSSSTRNVTSAGSNDAFVIKLNSSGNYSWGKRIGGSGDDRGRGIARLSSGDIAVIGDFSGTVDFDPGSSTKNKSSHGSTDAFFLRLSSGGSYKSATAIGGTGTDRGRAIAIDSSDKLYALGQFFESLSLDTGEGTVSLTSSGGKDLFLVRLV